MATASDGEKTPEGSGASPATIDPALESGRSKMQQDPGGSHQRPGAAGSLAMRSALHKPAEGEGGYDFSGSYDQTRRVRFKFGAHSLAVEATLAKLFESLTVECRWVAFVSRFLLPAVSLSLSLCLSLSLSVVCWYSHNGSISGTSIW